MNAASPNRQRHVPLQNQYVYYDPISGYLHKFRLEDSPDTRVASEASTADRSINWLFIVVGAIAAGLMAIIGALSL